MRVGVWLLLASRYRRLEGSLVGPNSLQSQIQLTADTAEISGGRHGDGTKTFHLFMSDLTTLCIYMFRCF